MPIELLSDVIEFLADQAGIYGAHDDENDEACEKRPCRICWTEHVRERIEAAVKVEAQLARGGSHE